MKIYLKHLIRLYFGFLRQRTPSFDGHVKHFIWGRAEETKKTDTIPKIIWLYWHEESITSNTVLICIDQIKNLHPDYTICLLNSKNLLEYLPKFPSEILSKPSNFVSDMVRLMLLEQHGGIYLDSTVLLSERVDWSILIKLKDNSEAVLYYTDENTLQYQYPMVETWFIAATPQSKFISDWRKEYEKCILISNNENYIKNNNFLQLSDFPMDPTYYISYLAGQIVMRKSQNYRLSLLRAEDSAFIYGLGFKKKWDATAMVDVLLLNKKTDPLPNLIKLIRFDRARLDLFINRGFYKSNSWLGELIDNQKTKA